MLAVIAAILLAIALVLHLMRLSEYTIETFTLGGLLCVALALIPALPAAWRSR